MSRTVATSTPTITHAEAQAFLNREAALLDDGRHEEWLALFAHDGVFWVPSNDADYNPAHRVSIVYEDRVKMADRVSRLSLGRAIQENPSRTMHVISNVTVLDSPGPDAPPDTVEILTNLVLFVVHGARSSHHAARCRYLLRREEDRWRIVLRKLMFLDNDQYAPNLAFLF
ncbi:MAG: aromatic-ring-hydroxylating dioxygenase subunit beta [Mycobacterium sp.]